MRILIATGIYPPDIGGPAQYARGVEEAWKKEGHTVKVLAFRLERKLPTGIRHLYYFFRVLFSISRADFVFSPDTFSAAIPALLASKLCGKKIILRTGGDFLWEQFVERTGDLVLLNNFYDNTNTFGLEASVFPRQSSSTTTKTKVRKGTRHVRLNIKERTIFKLLRFLFRYADAIIFSTKWQRDIFKETYQLDLNRCFIVENYYGPRVSNSMLQHTIAKKIFVGGTRELKWKNLPRVEEAFAKVQKKGLPVSLELQTGSHGQFLADIQASYAVILASLGDISPNTILEAIQYGKPFILTRETGLYEKLKDIGVWVNPEDVNDIAAKIEWLADEKNYEEQCKKVAAFTFEYSYDDISREILTCYQEL